MGARGASLRALAARLRGLLHGSNPDEPFNDEMQEHLQLLAERFVAQGMSAEEARLAARRQFGNTTLLREDRQRLRTFPSIESLRQDVYYALRVLRKAPGFTIVTVLTLALGIGANTAIFSLIDAVLLRSLPVRDPQQLVLFRWTAHAQPKIQGKSGYGDCDRNPSEGSCPFSVPLFEAVRAQTNTFSGMAAFAGPIDVDVNGNGSAAVAQGTYVSGDYFSTLGVRAVLGRSLTPADNAPSAQPAIVLDYGYWVRAFAADPSAIGRTVHLDDTPATIVGVVDPHFTNLTPGKSQDFFMPLSLVNRVRDEWAARVDYLRDPGEWWIVMLGRLRPGVSIDQAQAAATTIFRNETVHGPIPAFRASDAPGIHLQPAAAGLNGESSRVVPMLELMMIVVGFLLLIACANVAGLTLVRSRARRKEFALRLALGARRARLIRQVLTESLLLATAGGALGLFVFVWQIGAITAMAADGADATFPYVVSPDWRVLTFTVAATCATGILLGLAPALRGSRIDLTPSLKESGASVPGAAAHRGHGIRLGDGLVIVQVALSIVVLVGAALLVQTLRNLQGISPGFDARNVLLFRIDPTIAGYSGTRTQQLYGNLRERLAAVPGVMSVSYSEEALLAGGWSGTDLHLDDAPAKQNLANIKQLPVGLNFFSTMRIPIIAGRAFNAADVAAAGTNNAARDALHAAPSTSPRAAASAGPSPAREGDDQAAPVPVIVNEAFAKTFLAHHHPLGMHIGDAQRTDAQVQHPGPGYTIVGIAGDTKYDQLDVPTEPILFVPVVGNSAHFEVRAAANPTALVTSVRDVVSSIDNNLPVTQIRTQTEQIDRMLFQQRMVARLSGWVAMTALLLACIGLYGLLSYEVAGRTRELGIRMALGAQRRAVLRLVIAQGMVLSLIGTAIGVAAALGVTRFLSAMLYGIHPDDLATFGGVAIGLTLVALTACVIPAGHAMRVDPLVALKHE